MASLSNEVIKLSSIRDTARKDLATKIDEANDKTGDNRKLVILDPQLIDAFKYCGITTDAFKKEKGVEGIYPLQEKRELIQVKTIVYFVRPSVDVLRSLTAHITMYAAKNSKTNVYVNFVPKRTVMVDHILTNEYKIDTKCNLTLGDCDIDFFPLDDDVLSMEMGGSFKSIFQDGDFTSLLWIARSIIKLQSARFGPIPLIRGKGTHAAKVVNMIRRLQNEVGADFIAEQPSEIEALYLIDRSVDVLTPLMTQLTYEGLIEELYGIDAAHFDPPFDPNTANETVATSPVERDRKIALNNGDRMFSEIRDKNFSTVGSVLHQKSVWVKQSYERRKDVQGLKDLKEFMKGLPEMQEFHRLIGVHANIASNITKVAQSNDFRKGVTMEHNIIQQEEEKDTIEYIEDLINKGEPLVHVLRLLCAFCVVNNGLKPKLYDSMRESLMLSYGIPQMIAVMHNLDKAKLLYKNDGKSSFTILRKSCRLWTDKLTEKTPNDAAFAYSGYCPMTTRLVECIARSHDGWTNPNDAAELAPGDKQELRNDTEVPGGTRVIMLFFIGGVTHAEISTIRFLTRQLAQSGEPKHFVIATTNITSGGKFIQSLLPFKI